MFLLIFILLECEKSVVFEVTAVTLQQMTIVFEHPAYDSMITGTPVSFTYVSVCSISSKR